MASPVFKPISGVKGSVGAVERLQLVATDADNDSLTFSADVLPRGITVTSDGVVQGVYLYEETVETTFSVSDGVDSDTMKVSFSVARDGYDVVKSSVDLSTINRNSPLISVLTGNQLSIGDEFDYPRVVSNRHVEISSDGLVTVSDSGNLTLPDIYIRDKSNSYNRTGPYSVSYIDGYSQVSITDPDAQADKFYGDRYYKEVKSCESGHTKIKLTNAGSAFDIVNADKIKVEMISAENYFCTDSSKRPEYFDLTAGEGFFNVRLGRITPKPGVYKLKITYYDAYYPKGAVFTEKNPIKVYVS